MDFSQNFKIEYSEIEPFQMQTGENKVGLTGLWLVKLVFKVAIHWKMLKNILPDDIEPLNWPTVKFCISNIFIY